MSAEVLERAFEPFFTTKAKGVGSGLGLATVWGIVAQAGGYAQIYSEPGIGTTLTALFPVTETAPVEEAAMVEATPRGDGEAILVVEDEEALREVTRRVLARNGYSVLVAASGAEALSVSNSFAEPIDLLLTDVIMPGMLGKEVVERIRLARPDIGVLYMSGYAHPVLASQGTLDLGISLVEKPFSERDLVVRVRQVIDNRTRELPATARPTATE
jgi:CheY-like chemotaxis protein